MYIHICNLCEVILLLSGTIKFTTKNQSQPVWTSFFWVVDRLGPVFKGLVVVLEYLKWSRPVVVASCLILKEKKTGLNWTCKHYSSWKASYIVHLQPCPSDCNRWKKKRQGFAGPSTPDTPTDLKNISWPSLFHKIYSKAMPAQKYIHTPFHSQNIFQISWLFMSKYT